MSSINRSKGRTATASAAYRTGQSITTERTGVVHDYTRKGGVVDLAMYLPEGVPAMTTAELWNKAESAENRKNSTVARELLVALPHELTTEQRRELVDVIAASMVGRYGVAVEAAIHQPGAEGDERNHHAHMMFTTRRMDASGQLGEKTRELDVLPRGSAEVIWIRLMVQEHTNQALERAGLDERVDWRSWAARAAEARAEFEKGPLPLDQHADAMGRWMETEGMQPTMHEGPKVTAAKRAAKRLKEPFESTLAQENELRRERQELAQLDAQIYHFEHFAPLQAAAAAARQQEQERQDQGRRVAELRRQLSEAKDANHQAQTTAKNLRERLNAPTPAVVAEAQRLRVLVDQAKAQAQQWRAEHPKQAWLADKLGRPLEVDRVVTEAANRYNTSPELSQARQLQADRRELSAELERIAAQLPTLAKGPRRIEDELLLHDGDELLRQNIEDRLRVVETLEQSMDAERSDHVHGARMALVERLEHSPTGTDLVQVYRDAERLLTTAQRLEAGCAKARKLEVLEETKVALREARSLIEKNPHRAQPELVEALSAIQEQEAQNLKLRGMDPGRWPELATLERLQGDASALRDSVEGNHEQQAMSRPEERIQARSEPESGPEDKPRSMPRMR